MERALTLVATGTLTVEMARASKGKSVILPRTLNLSTGKESKRQMGFNDAAWGKATRAYATSACSLTNAKFDVVTTEAQEFMKPIRARNKTLDTTDNDNDDDERACLVDNSGSESDFECKSISFEVQHSTNAIFQNLVYIPPPQATSICFLYVFCTIVPDSTLAPVWLGRGVFFTCLMTA